MTLLTPLGRRPIALIWGGQVLSAVGDELYKVALIWLAVGLGGADAGYLGALEAAAVLAVGLGLGSWADRCPPKAVMVAVDLGRAAVVALVPFAPVSWWVLLPVATLVSGASALFDPALQAWLPAIAPEAALLHATNGILEATRRLARILGPALVAALQAWLAPIHFFTLDALTFVGSAMAVALTHGTPGLAARPSPKATPGALVKAALAASSIVWGLWSLGFLLGLALLIHQRGLPMSAYGLIIAAYGSGNLASNLAFAGRPVDRPGRWIFTGLGVVGLGFLAMGAAPSLPWLALAAAFTALGGPLDDLAFLALLQRGYQGQDVSRLFRLRMVTIQGGMLACLAAAPTLYRHVPVPTVLAGAGVVALLVAGLGLAGFGEPGRSAGKDGGGEPPSGE